jgi:hypothetical protein
LKKAFKKHDLEIVNSEEEDRFESIAIAKLRGKGPPKKKREKDCRSHLAPTIGQLLICHCGCSIEEKEEVIQPLIEIL